MTTTIISNYVSYGQMTNSMVSKLIALQTIVERLGDAVATASTGYTGVPGTQFEGSPMGGPGSTQNLFGVQPSATPGEQGEAYSYALGRIHEEWGKFWALAEPYIEQLDNGVTTP